MIGFGALRAMNDAVKANRELLKSGKTSFIDRDLTYQLRTGEIIFHERKANPEATKLARASALRNRNREIMKSLIILVVSIAAVWVAIAILANY